MNKKKMLTSLVATSMLGGLFVGGLSANAAPVDSDNTKVEFGFIKDYNPPKPAPNGQMTLRWTPKAFQFGNAHTVTTGAHDYEEINTTGGVGRYVVVDDQRPTASGNEWKVTASLSNITDGSNTLTGAKIEMALGNDVYEYTGSNEPIDADISTTVATGIATTFNPTVTLTQGGGAVPVSKGPGTVSGQAYATKMTNIKLKDVTHLAAYAGKQFSGNITWTLSDDI
ncbi:WxL domain-containing protein [Enterococcus sp. DIV0756]|uniref:WxL domain-containing protein n=1 Tax=Enterococcus sp. DIV0756 TaxID=2774636 RepID=UPI003F20EBB9